MLAQIAGSAQNTRSTIRTKIWIRITSWATRILALLSIVFCIVAFSEVEEPMLGVFLIFTAIISILSPLNFSCCCYSDCSRNTKVEKAIGHCGVYVWMFMSNMCYVIMFGYSWLVREESRKRYYDYGDDMYYDTHSSQYRSRSSYSNTKDKLPVFDTLFAFTLIITSFLTMCNLYSFCLVYKYGCCFMNKVDRDRSQQRVGMADLINPHISTNGGGLPVNGFPFGNATVDAQQTTLNSSKLMQLPQYQPYTTGPYDMSAPPHQASGVITDSMGSSIPSSMEAMSGQSVSPPPYTEANPNVK
ncbi:uncharacterized protein LOC128223160 [Mya arenaria]|uniref:uncharacterized protein LOC128223160 n=1 Tax=Mya arenaria TaxID=6604 RepID=UPI0022E71EBB|nr:uncharacterized protein LOC128223160 [Mya arenaria]